MVRIWQAKCSSLLLCVFIVAVACMRSSAAATLKLGCFLYICLPKAVIHMKQAIETEWLKRMLRSSYYLCYCPCIVDD